MGRNKYKFLDATIELTDESLEFHTGKIQKVNQLLGRRKYPESIQLDEISKCHVNKPEMPTNKPELIIAHSGGTEEIKFNPGLAHKFTSLFGFDGEDGAKALVEEVDVNEDEQLMEEL